MSETQRCHRIDCATPITGTPVTDPDDRAGRRFCSPECLEAEAEASYEQRYEPAGTGDTGEWPPLPGRRPPLSYAEEQADIINATGA